MKRLSDHIRYYSENLSKSTQTLLFRVLTMLSFLMIAFYFGYIVYYSIFCYSLDRVIAGSLALCIMIHLNKSLG